MLKLFKWTSLQPDLRKWKPSNPIFEPQELFVAVEVPDELLTKGGHLLPEGMRYCIDQFEMQMGEPDNKVEVEEDREDVFSDTASDEEWE